MYSPEKSNTSTKNESYLSNKDLYDRKKRKYHDLDINRSVSSRNECRGSFITA